MLSPLLALVPPAVGAVAIFVRRQLAVGAEGWHRDRVLEELGDPVEPGAVARGSIAVLEGRLRLDTGKGNLVSFHPYGTSFLAEANAYAVTSEPDAELVIGLASGEVARIVGEPQVLVGDVVTEHRATAADASAFGRKLAARRGPGQLRVLHDGTRVRIRGRIERVTTSYRGKSATYDVHPAGDAVGAGFVPIAAVGRLRLRHRGRVDRAIAASAVVLGLLALYVVFGLNKYELAMQIPRLDSRTVLADEAFAAGRFADASALYPRNELPSLRELEAHLVARRGPLAEAAIGRHLASRLHPDEAAMLTCIRDHIRIGEHAVPPRDLCRPTPLTQYVARLEVGTRGDDEEAAREVIGDLEATVADPVARFAVHPTGMENAILGRVDWTFPDDLALAAMHADIALYHAISGHGSTGWGRLDTLAGAPPPTGRRLTIWRQVLALGAIAAYHAGDEARLDRYAALAAEPVATAIQQLRRKPRRPPATPEAGRADGIALTQLRLALQARSEKHRPAALTPFTAVLIDSALAWEIYDLERFYAAR